MRIHNHKWNIWGRRILVLLLLCGLLAPLWLQIDAASVTYVYDWIKSDAGLPTDNQWHDYFIAWEDLDDKNKFWFADYHWYTPDGYNNYDAGGSHWMEYRAASTLPDITSASFTSKNLLGHMQIKFAGRDKDNANAPMYYIRVSKMNGTYSYFTRYEPANNEDSADAFTFLDKGDVYHIFVNIAGKADRYLTRDGQDLETTESSSYGGGEKYRPLRVYRRSFTVDQTADDNKDVIGKKTMYEYTWVNTATELYALPNSNGAWHDIMLAWEDHNGSRNNSSKVWFTKEFWTNSNNQPNYNNDGANEWWYYSNDYLGSDGYSSPNAESFLLPYKASHFQMQFVDWDKDNKISDPSYLNGLQVECPTFYFRFDIGRGKYIYIGNDAMYENMSDVENYTVKLRMGTEKDEEIAQGDLKGSFWIFNNIARAQDEYFCRAENSFTIGNWYGSDYWEFPFRIYTCRELEYDAIVKSFTIGKGATYSIDRQLIVDKDVTITVEDGGVLTVDKELLNDGKIVVKNGGTVIVNEGGYIMAYDQNKGGRISLDGGNLLIMDGAKVICDQSSGTLDAKRGATIVNRGMLMVGNKLILNNNSCLINEANAMLLVGGRVAKERGGVGAFAFEEIVSRLDTEMFTYLISNNSKIINKGVINEPNSIYTTYSDDAKAKISHMGDGRVDIR